MGATIVKITVIRGMIESRCKNVMDFIQTQYKVYASFAALNLDGDHQPSRKATMTTWSVGSFLLAEVEEKNSADL